MSNGSGQWPCTGPDDVPIVVTESDQHTGRCPGRKSQHMNVGGGLPGRRIRPLCHPSGVRNGNKHRGLGRICGLGRSGLMPNLEASTDASPCSLVPRAIRAGIAEIEKAG